MEKTLILIKPDAIQRELVGEIIARIERKGLKVVGLKMMQITEELAREHYSHLADKPFFPEIRDFMTGAPVIAMCVEGIDAIETVRRLAGITLSREADPGTIRGDYAMSIQCNLIHASDSPETAKAEVPRFFKSEEHFTNNRANETSIYNQRELG